MKRIFTLIIALVMVFSTLPAVAQTSSVDAPQQHRSAVKPNAVSYSDDLDILELVERAPGEGVYRDDLDDALNVEGGSIHFKNEFPECPWTVVEEDDRTYAISGGAGEEYAVSVLSATVEVEAGDCIRFDYKAWGESDIVIWDSCNFYVDGRRVFCEGQLDNDWLQFTYIFEQSGTVLLYWAYMKDGYGNAEGDYFAIDNVYIGEPIHVEEIVATESLDIVVNRFGQLEWTVLPAEADAFNAVIFTSEDPDIAFVDLEGIVHGMSEGVTNVTVSSRVDPEVYAVCEVTVTDTGIPLARLYGKVAFDATYEFTNQWVTFTDATPQLVESLGEALNVRSATYAYGNVYGFTDSGEFFIAPFDDITNVTYFPCPFEEDWWITALTFDYTRGSLIGLCAGDHDYSIAAFSPNDGTLLGSAVIQTEQDELTLYGICADEEGTIYSVSRGGGILHTIDPLTGEATVIGSSGLPCQYNQDICYDYSTGDIYWAQFYSEEWNYLYRVNKETAEVTNCGRICPLGAEVTGLFMIPENEPGASDDVAVTGVSIKPEDAMIHVGDTASFRAFIQPFNASNRNVEWSVDDESIISIDENGTVTGLAAGVGTVTCTTEDGGFTATAAVTVLPPLGEQVAGFYFEDEEEVAQWTFIDADGDGHNWEWGYMSNYSYEGDGVIYSESYSYETWEEFYPDNWAVSPAVELGEGSAVVTLWYCGEDEEYAAEHFQIYAGTEPDIETMVPVSQEYVASGNYSQAEANLSEFAGGTVYIAIRHFNVHEMSALNIDQVEFFVNSGEQPPAVIYGDINGDEEVNISDVIITLRASMGLIELTDQQFIAADVNGSEDINVADAILIMRVSMGILDHFPIEE